MFYIDEETVDYYSYSPNELARLPQEDYEKVVGCNIKTSIKEWEQDNLEYNKETIKCKKL